MSFIIGNLFQISLVPLAVGNIMSFSRFYATNKRGDKITKRDLIFSIAWTAAFSVLAIIGNVIS